MLISMCRYLFVTKFETLSPALDSEYKAQAEAKDSGDELKPKQEMDVEFEVNGIVLKPKQEIVAKSAAQIVHEQHQK